ncbi:hypothetical protein [Streptomyces sp. enrichment culture]|uniref:hypothetical protein n=1 Tax=Streptomyces sp. enrichment culture TaxID=1795815 RepID=UPI003F56A49C
MRSRRAAAVVVLASMLLLHLCVPALAADPRATARPAASWHDERDERGECDGHGEGDGHGERGECDERGEAAPAAPEGVFTPSPGGEDAPLHRLAARSPRHPGAAGVHPPAPGTPSAAAEPRTALRSRPARPPQRRGPDDAARTASTLQTFRC